MPPKPDDESGTEEELREHQRRKDEDAKRLVIYHDKSAFAANDDQPRAWGDAESFPIHPKGRGSGIMVSDFIEEHEGYLRLTPGEMQQAQANGLDINNHEARKKIKYGERREP